MIYIFAVITLNNSTKSSQKIVQYANKWKKTVISLNHHFKIVCQNFILNSLRKVALSDGASLMGWLTSSKWLSWQKADKKQLKVCYEIKIYIYR